MNTTTLGGEAIARAIAEGDETWRLFQPFGLTFAGGPLAPVAAQAPIGCTRRGTVGAPGGIARAGDNAGGRP